MTAAQELALHLIPIDEILPQKRRRALNPAYIAELANSINEVGLGQPITVGCKRDGVYPLIAGEHRLEACKCLGWEQIPAIVSEMDDTDAALWRIDENLQRAELSELERAEHLAERKRLYLLKHPETAQHVAGGRAKAAMAKLAIAEQPPSFVADTTAKTGLPGRSIRRAIQRGEAIAPEVRDEIRDMPDIAEKGVELDALAEVPAEEQVIAVQAVKTGRAKSVREALTRDQKRACPTKSEMWRTSIMSVWERGTPEDQAWFLKRIQQETT